MRIAVVGPLRDQFIHIQRHCTGALGTRHSLYWVNKDSSSDVKKHARHADALILCTGWIRHAMTEQARAFEASGLKVVLVPQRGTSSVISAIENLITKANP